MTRHQAPEENATNLLLTTILTDGVVVMMVAVVVVVVARKWKWLQPIQDISYSLNTAKNTFLPILKTVSGKFQTS